MSDLLTEFKKRAKNNILPYILWLLLSAVLIVVDQISKNLAKTNLSSGGEVKVIPYLFNFVYVENKGAAWGMLANQRWIFITVSIIAIIFALLALLYFARYKKGLVIPLVMILSGGIGNMIDRIYLGYVVDFIQFDFFKSFPVFNVADSYVTVGGTALLIYLLFFDKTLFRKEKK